MTTKKKKKRKNPYVPHVAAAKFKPTEDWTHKEALKAYKSADFPFPVDKIHYKECIAGMSKLPDNSIDVLVADPPFGIDFNGKEAIYNRDETLVVEGYHEIEGDYSDFTHAWISKIPRILKETGSAWIFSGWTNLSSVLNAVESTDLTLVNHIIWKYQFGVFTRRKFVSSHYHLLFLVKNPKKYYFNKIQHYPLDVWDIKRTYLKGEMKNGRKLPENLVMRCIDFTSRPGNLVLDPFMGNATTAVASKGSYRHYLGFEINPEMRPIIENNLGLIDLGGFYIPYSERKDELVEKAKEKFGVADEEKDSIQTQLA
jgi:site-specific DNA-methyltransferase (adenine-specific)